MMPLLFGLDSLNNLVQLVINQNPASLFSPDILSNPRSRGAALWHAIRLSNWRTNTSSYHKTTTTTVMRYPKVSRQNLFTAWLMWPDVDIWRRRERRWDGIMPVEGNAVRCLLDLMHQMARGRFDFESMRTVDKEKEIKHERASVRRPSMKIGVSEFHDTVGGQKLRHHIHLSEADEAQKQYLHATLRT